jgi:hypothetical protein
MGNGTRNEKIKSSSLINIVRDQKHKIPDLLFINRRNKMDSNFAQLAVLLNKSEMELKRIEFFKKINVLGENQRACIIEATEAHKYMEWFFDDWAIVFENGDYINTENCPVWNGSYDNFLSVAFYYLTPKGIKLT